MFRSARIKLTASYLLIIMLIMFSFSSIVFINVNRFTQRELEKHERRLENRLREFQEIEDLNSSNQGNIIPLDVPRGPQRPLNLPEGFQAPISEETILQIRRNTIYMLVILNVSVIVVSGGIAYWFSGKTLKPIEEMTNKQKQFIADAAHELKTPLTAMKTTLEVNRRTKKFKQKEVEELLDSVLEDVDSLASLTNGLLSQSRYQDYDISKHQEVFDVKKETEGVVRKLKSKIEAKKLSVNVEMESLDIKADKKSIVELLTILIDNATKFNKESGTINVKSKVEGKYVYIDVIDSGTGISKKDIPHIFDRFYKADASRTKTGQEGFGLGLSIAKGITQAHKGNISVKSTVNKGTTFTIKLPLNI